ncbi:MAG TPA: CDP-glucose 4,6-dehydratase, partial [Bacteroidales bacterium]|nr:CDP-glucose 4,6-dehydratase [Bacteroidales bacterium]
RDSYDDPKKTFDTNIGGTVNILEAVRLSSSVKAALVITSDKCYENKEWVWGYRENDPMGGHDPYSASKGGAEIVCSAYRRSFFDKAGCGPHIGFATVRAGNVIGGGDWAADRLIPDIVRATSKKNSVYIRNPLATRPWQHVLEPISGYLTLGQRLLEKRVDYADGWNFGPSPESNLTVDEVVQLCKKYWNNIAVEYSKNPADAHEANLLMLDCSKANKIMHWKPVWNFDKIIEKTIEWYKNYYEANHINTRQDIKEYVQNAIENKVIWTI